MISGTGSPAVGLLLVAGGHAQFLGAAQQAEDAGFDEIWVSEDYFGGGGIASAASVLARIGLPVGLGVAPVAGRHPAVLAMEIATLAGLHPGRVHAGIGAGVPELLHQIGLRPRAPLAAVREAIRGLRALLDGETLEIDNEAFVAHHVALGCPPDVKPKLYIGASGPKMMQLSGAEADGTVLSVLSGLGYVRWARERLIEGGARSGHRLVVYALCALHADADVARERARPLVAAFALMGNPRHSLSEVQGFADEAEALAELDPDVAISRIPQRWLADLTLAGTPDECVAKIRALADAGADAVVLCFPTDRSLPEQIALAGREVLPRVTSQFADREAAR